jgi:hypothetical protein
MIPGYRTNRNIVRVSRFRCFSASAEFITFILTKTSGQTFAHPSLNAGPDSCRSRLPNVIPLRTTSIRLFPSNAHKPLRASHRAAVPAMLPCSLLYLRAIVVLAASVVGILGKVTFDTNFVPLSVAENTRGVLLLNLPAARESGGNSISYTLQSSQEAGNVSGLRTK